MKPRLSQQLETAIEQLIFASRWLLAPLFVGLALSLVVLVLKFCEALFHIATHAVQATESEVILGVLSLVDLVLTASLLIIVIFSGYENFVSKIDHTNHEDWPAWMGTIDFTALKLKLLSSIVAISAVQLLRLFMGVKTVTDRELMWYVVIHLVFVISSVLLALSDRIAGGSHSPPPHGAQHAPEAIVATHAEPSPRREPVQQPSGKGAERRKV